ncbi:MAG TPA: carboxypeptidase-like regulatory domain-containing protein [Gemmatimonadales bacterium]|jgi:hypothetical protein
MLLNRPVTPSGRLALAVMLAVTLGAPLRMTAQSARGRVIDAVLRTPVVNALVELRDHDSKSVVTGLTSSAGSFLLAAPAAGDYTLRIVAIGFAPRPLETIVIPLAGVVLGDLVLTRQEFTLPDLVAIGQARSCGKKRIVTDDLFGRMLASAHTALEVMSASIDRGQMTFAAMTVATHVEPGRATTDTVHQQLTRWPLEGVDAGIHGIYSFGHIDRGMAFDGIDGKEVAGIPGTQLTSFAGPDARILFSDWFLENHCFALQRIKGRTEPLRISFTPVRKSSLIDISGEFDLDPRTLALLRLSFRGENLPRWVDSHAAGGEVRFAPLPSGVWLPTAWTIWAPVQGSSSCDWRVVGLNERRGVVLSVTTPGAAGSRPDSIRLAGALLPRQTRFDKEKCVARARPSEMGGSG